MSRKNHQPRISRLFSAVDMAQGFIPFSAERADFYKKTGCWEDETHIQLLDRIRQQYGDKVAAIQGEKSLTYAQLYQYAAQYASYLQQQGIQAEDFIVIQSPNVIEFFIVLFALYYIGARPVFCLNGHGAYEIENIAMTSRAVGYIKINQPGLRAKDAEDVCLGFSQPNVNLWFRQTLNSTDNIEAAFAGMLTASAVVAQYQASAHSIAFLQLSGGTTGLPKLIPRTLR